MGIRSHTTREVKDFDRATRLWFRADVQPQFPVRQATGEFHWPASAQVITRDRLPLRRRIS
jgi:hypothetical protein